jgi:SAM-dependent methyltransferase
VAQANILELPFAPQQYDVVVCLGVVQHTPSPEQTIAALYDQVRPGGWLVIDHYTAPPPLWRYTRTAPVLRMFMKHMKPSTTLRITQSLTNTLLPLHKAVKDKPLLHSIVTHLSPLITIYQGYPELPEKLQYEWTMLDTHDVLTDWYKHYRTTDEIRDILAGLGAVDIWSAYGGNGVEARGRRPA